MAILPNILYTLTRGQTTIKGEGNKITISNAGITVTGEKTVLNLGAEGYDGTLTIDGKTSGAFVSVSEGATANMYEHVTLQNWKSSGQRLRSDYGFRSSYEFEVSF